LKITSATENYLTMFSVDTA